MTLSNESTLALCTIGLALFLTECADAAEFCEQGAKATAQGTISEIIDWSDEKEKSWELAPKKGVQTDCLYQVILIEDTLPENCKAGAKFTLSGRWTTKRKVS